MFFEKGGLGNGEVVFSESAFRECGPRYRVTLYPAPWRYTTARYGRAPLRIGFAPFNPVEIMTGTGRPAFRHYTFRCLDAARGFARYWVRKAGSGSARIDYPLRDFCEVSGMGGPRMGTWAGTTYVTV